MGDQNRQLNTASDIISEYIARMRRSREDLTKPSQLPSAPTMDRTEIPVRREAPVAAPAPMDAEKRLTRADDEDEDDTEKPPGLEGDKKSSQDSEALANKPGPSIQNEIVRRSAGISTQDFYSRLNPMWTPQQVNDMWDAIFRKGKYSRKAASEEDSER